MHPRLGEALELAQRAFKNDPVDKRRSLSEMIDGTRRIDNFIFLVLAKRNCKMADVLLVTIVEVETTSRLFCCRRL